MAHEIDRDADVVRLKSACPVCGSEAIITVGARAMDRYNEGHLIQSCFPELSANDRERLITGICPTCWDRTFAEDDE